MHEIHNLFMNIIFIAIAVIRHHTQTWRTYIRCAMPHLQQFEPRQQQRIYCQILLFILIVCVCVCASVFALKTTSQILTNFSFVMIKYYTEIIMLPQTTMFAVRCYNCIVCVCVYVFWCVSSMHKHYKTTNGGKCCAVHKIERDSRFWYAGREFRYYLCTRCHRTHTYRLKNTA